MLARQLAVKCPDIIVLPEFRLLEILVRIGNDSVRRLAATDLKKLILLDQQFDNLRFSENEIQKIITASQGKGIRTIMHNIVTCYLPKQGKKKPLHVLFQRGHYLTIHKKLIDIFGNVKFILITRDPRASMSSQLNTYSPRFKGLKMGRNGNLPYLVKQWRTFTNNTRQLEAHHHNIVYKIKYEDFCIDSTSIFTSLLNFIKTTEACDATFELNIGENEIEIHKNIYKPISSDRINSWKSELQHYQGIYIENKLHDTLLSCNYKLYFSTGPEPFAKLKAILLVPVIGFTRNLLYNLFILIEIFRKPSLLVERIKELARTSKLL